MKKVLLMLMLIASSNFIHSQISRVTEEQPILIGKAGGFIGKFDIKCEKYSRDSTYVFTYRDINYRKLEVFKSFEFKDVDNAFNDFYKVLIDGFKKKPKEDIVFEIPEGYVKLHFVKAIGITNVNIASSKNGVSGVSGWLSKRKVKKLFGK